MEVGSAHGKVSAFLLSYLKESSRTAYKAAVESFSSELATRGVDHTLLSEEELDWVVAEYIVERHDETNPSSGIAAASNLVAGSVKQNPRLRLVVSCRVLDVWPQRHPPAQAPSLPKSYLWAIATWLVIAGQSSVAALCVYLFSFCMRASEGISLTPGTLLRTPSSWVAVLARTRRGLEQKIELVDTFVCKWLDNYFAAFPMQVGSKLFDVSYNKLSYWLRKAASSLCIGDHPWSSHSLRRGGATALLIAGMPFKDIQYYGRWLSERSCREYLRRGEVAMMRSAESLDSKLKHKIEMLASISEQVFTLVPVD